VNYAYIGMAVAALVVGFAAGLLTFKRSNRWCPACGHPLICKANCGGRLDVSRQVGSGLGVNRGHFDR
jgi:NADH pyrophosphatase NudC (nudix superfamily)